jgi:uncharacterized protein (DUF2384 family)
MSTNEAKLYASISANITPFEVIHLVQTDSIHSGHLKLVKEISDLSDEKLSDSLNLNVKTFRTYKNSKATALKADLQEHTILLLSLIKHGIDVFGNKEMFNQWLETANFQLGMRKPLEYLNTISGIKFIDNRISGIEFGDNA